MSERLSAEAMRTYLQRLSYKPGWSMTVEDGDWEGPQIFIVFQAENVYSQKGEPVDIGVRSHIPPMESTDQFERWIAWRLGRIESHESREFLKRDGEIIFDPHAESVLQPVMRVTDEQVSRAGRALCDLENERKRESYTGIPGGYRVVPAELIYDERREDYDEQGRVALEAALSREGS